MPTGNLTTYNLNVGIYLDAEDFIHMLDPTDVPLQQGYGMGRGAALARTDAFEKQVDWWDESLLLPKSTLDGAITDIATTLSVQSGEALRFGVGDVLLIEDEYLRVTAANYSTDTLTVTRGYGGSTGAAHADNALVLNVGAALPEGSDPETARALDRVKVSNNTQIFGPIKVSVTGTQQAVRKYGVKTTEFDKQVGNRIKESAIIFEQAAFYGVKFEDATNNWRTMGGFAEFITSNVDSSTTTLTDTLLADQLQACYDNGGNPNWIETGPTQKRVISGFDSSAVRFQNGDRARGQVVDVIHTDFGTHNVGMNRNIRSSDLFIRSRDQAVVATLRPQVFEMLSKTGDSVHGQVLSERTLKFYKQKHAARFTALT